jgi:hypothetical protein
MRYSPLDSNKTLQTQRAFNKLLWIQNDFITRHYQSGISGTQDGRAAAATPAAESGSPSSATS